ncbi:MAG: aldo/keto reductase [Bacteroidia bacterium]
MAGESATARLILGTVQLGLAYGINNAGGKPSMSEAFSILKVAEDAGITHLDTAAAYGNSEAVIGNYIRQNGESRFRIITKLNGKADWQPSLQQSLTHLGVEKVDVLFFHTYQDYLKNSDHIDNLIKTEKDRSFSRLGVSVYTNEEMEALSGDDRISVIQAPFNLLDNDYHRSAAFEICKSQGKEIHTRSVFLQGLFFMPVSRIPARLQPVKPYVMELTGIANDLGIDVGALALQYALSKDYIDKVLVGVDGVAQLQKNLKWTQITVPEKAFQQIDKIEVADKDLLNPSKW